MTVPAAIQRRRRRALVPRGQPLDRATWRARHTLLTVLLVAHVPVLVALSVAGAAPAGPPAVAGPAGVALVIASTARSRTARSAAVIAGLAWCSGVLVAATATPAAHVHAVLLVLLASLYQNRLPVLLAAAAGVLGYGIGGRLAPDVVFGAAAVDAASLLALLMVLLLVAAAVAACSWWPAGADGATEHSAARLQAREHAVAAELQAAAAVKSELLTVVSHEFRTPIASITGLARTLSARLDDLDREAVEACLGGIDHHARRLSRLVHNVLEASGEIDVDQTAVTDLAGLARAMVQEALEAHGHRVRVTVDLPLRLDAGVGPLAARQMLANLCDNAVKFTPSDGFLEVTGSRRDDEVVVVVANEACVPSERDVERWFEPFVQADSSDTRAVDGIGLGLHVSRRLARAHGGDLSAEVRPGRVALRLQLPPPGRLCVSAGGGIEVLLEDIDTPVR